uniref:Uncharacterized protein n=1 Tax=Caenorhabditis japonica TaxID=281687 RepID=A0A8R1DYN7_CAEJA
MPTETNGVSFFTPHEDDDEATAAATSPGSEPSSTTPDGNVSEQTKKAPIDPKSPPTFHVNLEKIKSTETIVGPNQAKKARSFNMTEVDFSIAGISSAFAPVPVFNKESSNSGDTTLLSPKSSAQAIISAPSPTKKNYQNSPPDSPSPQRKLKKAKSPEDSEPPKGYYEAKQKERNERRRSSSKSPPRNSAEKTVEKEKKSKE